MKNILIAEFKHETNTFIKGSTGLSDFQSRNLLFGNKIIDYFKGNKNEIGGFIDFLSKYDDVNIIPSVAANACPSGIVEDEVYKTVRDKIISTCIENPNLDGILISFHGSMVSESSHDCEGDLLQEIRNVVGFDLPIFISMDFHANITEKMITNTTAMFPFDFYPHTDMYERGIEAAKNLYQTLDGLLRPVMCVKKLPILYPFIETSKSPHRYFLDKAFEYEKDPRVISVSIVSGFSYADTYETGASIIAQTNGELELASTIADELYNMVYNKRFLLKKDVLSVKDAVSTALSKKGLTVLADVSDNPGNGAPGDGTVLLEELIKHKANDCLIATIHDPETVMQAIAAGVGSKILVQLGGKTTTSAGKPIIAEAYIKNISDGVFKNKGIMSYGVVNNLGPTVVLVIDGISIIVTQNRHQPWDPEIFRSNGIDPLEANIIVLKSTVHYRATYSTFAKRIIDVESPNICMQDFKKLKYENVRRPIYPLDEI